MSSIATSSRHDAGERAAGDDDVVEGDVAAGSSIAAARAQDPALERHPLVDRELAGDELAEHGLELAGLGLREEADLAEVDAEERDVDLGHGAGGAQERAVAAEHDERVGRRQLARAAVEVAGLGAASGRCRARRHQPAARSRELDGGLDGRVVGEADARDASRRARRPRAIRSAMSAQPGPRREVEQELAVALRPEDRRGDDVARTEPELAAPSRRRARGPRDGSAGSRTTPWSRPALAGLELRLDERRRCRRAAARASRRSAPRTWSSEMNETSIDGEVDRLGQASSRSASGRSSAPSRRRAGRGGATRRAGRGRRRARRRGARRAAAGRR